MLCVSSGDNEPQDAGGGCDHCVCAQIVRFAMHQPCPFTEDRAVRGQNCVVAHYPVQPAIKLTGFVRVLSAGELDAVLYFGYDDGWNCKLVKGN